MIVVKNTKLEIGASIAGFFGMLAVAIYFLLTGLAASGAEQIYQLVLSSICFIITLTLFGNIIRIVRQERKRKLLKKYLGTRSYDYEN